MMHFLQLSCHLSSKCIILINSIIFEVCKVLCVSAPLANGSVSVQMSDFSQSPLERRCRREANVNVAAGPRHSCSSCCSYSLALNKNYSGCGELNGRLARKAGRGREGERVRAAPDKNNESHGRGQILTLLSALGLCLLVLHLDEVGAVGGLCLLVLC